MATAVARTGTVLVFPFESDSKIPDLDWMGDGLAELTAERLAEDGFTVLSRQERLAAIEKIGLPAGARFSHATMVKIAAEADADEVVFGGYVSDGAKITFDAHVLHMSPPGLSDDFTRTSTLQELVSAHAQFSIALECALERVDDCAAPQTSARSLDAASLPGTSALENFVHGIIAVDDEPRLRALREAARLAPAWDAPAFELGQAYFSRRDCESALPWFSRVPPDRPDGPEASFNTGVCYLYLNDSGRAEAAFSALLDRARSSDPADRLPDLAQAHNNLGIARLRMMSWNEAAGEFQRASEIDAEEPDYLVNLGIARLAEKQPAMSLQPLQRAMMLDPMDKGARSLVSSTLAALGQGNEASPGADPAVPSIPLDPVALTRLARISEHFDRDVLRPTVDQLASAGGVDSSRPRALSGQPR